MLTGTRVLCADGSRRLVSDGSRPKTCACDGGQEDVNAGLCFTQGSRLKVSIKMTATAFRDPDGPDYNLPGGPDDGPHVMVIDATMTIKPYAQMVGEPCSKGCYYVGNYNIEYAEKPGGPPETTIHTFTIDGIDLTNVKMEVRRIKLGSVLIAIYNDQQTPYGNNNGIAHSFTPPPGLNVSFNFDTDDDLTDRNIITGFVHPDLGWLWGFGWTFKITNSLITLEILDNTHCTDASGRCVRGMADNDGKCIGGMAMAAPTSVAGTMGVVADGETVESMPCPGCGENNAVQSVATARTPAEMDRAILEA